MTQSHTNPSKLPTPNYGIDAPAVLRNLFLFGALCLLLGAFLPSQFRAGFVTVKLGTSFFSVGVLLLLQGLAYLYYVKVGKFHHRDRILNLHTWRGDEQVLDVGCGRGLLLAGAAKRLKTGHATGIDVWSNVDMGGNSEQATQHNLALEGVTERCTIVGVPAQDMDFAGGSFDVIVSNLCLHNIYDRPTRLLALQQIVRVLKPGGVALISDYKLTSEYVREFASAGLLAERRVSWVNFPPLQIVIARKPA